MRIRSLVFAVSACSLLLAPLPNAANAAPLPIMPLAAQAPDASIINVQHHHFGGRGPHVGGPPRFARPGHGPGFGWRPRRPYVIGPGYRVARPWWRPGTAVAVGAALGFLAAGSAIAWAGQPPGPGYCWFYTDPSHRAGFWDVCPP